MAFSAVLVSASFALGVFAAATVLFAVAPLAAVGLAFVTGQTAFWLVLVKAMLCPAQRESRIRASGAPYHTRGS